MKTNVSRWLIAVVALGFYSSLTFPSSVRAQVEDHDIVWSAWGNTLQGDIVSGPYAGGHFAFVDGAEPQVSLGIGGQFLSIRMRLDGGVDLEAAGGAGYGAVTLPAALLADPGNVEVWLTHHAQLASLEAVEQAMSTYSPAMSGLAMSFGSGGGGGGGGGGIMPYAVPQCALSADKDVDREHRGDAGAAELMSGDARADCLWAGGALAGAAFAAGFYCTVCAASAITYGVLLPTCVGCVAGLGGTGWATRNAVNQCRRALQQAN
jgi:hypothetical protein